MFNRVYYIVDYYIRNHSSRLRNILLDILYLSIMTAFGGVVYLQNLERPLAMWDEAFYMSTARFSVENGHWLVPHVPYEAFAPVTQIGVQPFLLKPPLAIQLQMLSMELFGVSATAARLPTVGFTLMVAVLTYLFGREMYSRETGFIAAIVVLTTKFIFVGYHGGRSGTMDVQMVFFGTVVVGALLLSVRRDHHRRWLLALAGISLGLAILTKGFGAGVYGLVVLPVLVVHWKTFLTREGLIAAGLAVVIPLAWFAVVESFYGSVLGPMFDEQVLSRISGSMDNDPATFGFMKEPYFRKAPVNLDPWWYLLLTAFVTVPLGIYNRHGRSRLGRTTLFLCWWVLSVFGFFVVTGNHFWYLMPMVVPVGLLCGRMIDRGLRPSPEAAGFVVGSSLMLMHSPLVGRAIRFVSNGAFAPSPPVRFALVVAFVSVFIPIIYRKQVLPVVRRSSVVSILDRCVSALGRDSEWLSTPNSVADGVTLTKRAFTLSMIVLVVLQLPLADDSTSATTDQKDLGAQFTTMVPSDTTVYIHEDESNEIYTFVFYANRPVQSATLERLNSDPSIRYALLAPATVERLQRSHERIGSMAVYKGSRVLVAFDDPAQSRRTALPRGAAKQP